MPNEPEQVKPTQPLVRESTVDLANSARVACAILGVASEIFGAIVLWRGEAGAATVAFIILGAVLIILAASGVIPRRIKSGDHEVEMFRRQVIEGAQETADNALATMSKAEIEEFIGETLRSRDTDQSGQAYVAASRAQEALDSERQTLANLVVLDSSMSIQQNVFDPWDATLQLSGGDVVRLELKWKLSTDSVLRLLRLASEDPSAIYWIVVHAANQDELGRVSGIVNRYIEEESIRLVVSSDTPPTLHRVLTWLQFGAEHPTSMTAVTTF